MTMSKTRRAFVAGLLALMGTASIVFTLWCAKDREAKDRYTRFYDRVLHQQTNVSGLPIVKVLSADRGEPVSNVIIGLTLIGPDGGDGGFQCSVTDEAGVAHNHLHLAPGRYQYQLMPDPKSRFVQTNWIRSQPYVVVSNDGTTSIPSLRLEVDSGG